MKRIGSMLLILALAIALCACGAQEAAPPAAEKERPEGMESVLPGAQSAVPEAAERAKALIGQPVQELYDAIGEPLSAEYAPSCLGEGEDGELVYEGFTVYTYREGETETVQDVNG